MRQSKDGRLTHIRDGREKWFYDKVKRMEKERKSCQKKSLSEEQLLTKILVCDVYGVEMVANMRK